MSRNPRSSVANPDSRIHSCAPAPVAQKVASDANSMPLCSRTKFSPTSFTVLETCTPMLRLRQAPAKARPGARMHLGQRHRRVRDDAHVRRVPFHLAAKPVVHRECELHAAGARAHDRDGADLAGPGPAAGVDPAAHQRFQGTHAHRELLDADRIADHRDASPRRSRARRREARCRRCTRPRARWDARATPW